MAIPLTGQGGKGSSPRKNFNQSKYEENWERIFGNKKVEASDKKIEEDILVNTSTIGEL